MISGYGQRGIVRHEHSQSLSDPTARPTSLSLESPNGIEHTDQRWVDTVGQTNTAECPFSRPNFSPSTYVSLAGQFCGSYDLTRQGTAHTKHRASWASLSRSNFR